MLAGSVLRPVLPCSALVVDEADRVVAGAIVTARDGLPWIADVFRRPEARYAGLGANPLRRVISAATVDGLADISLVVSDANPARRVYEKLGFELTGTSLTVPARVTCLLRPQTPRRGLSGCAPVNGERGAAGSGSASGQCGDRAGEAEAGAPVITTAPSPTARTRCG
ncbi:MULTISPECIES: GNAT family N-acetyltransferase [unclassified Streptomyces]